MKKYNAVVIGCGSIGALKPDKYDSPTTENILTMAHAFYNHPQIDLIGVIDTNWIKAQKASLKWITPKPYIYIFDIQEPIDVIAVCVPTETHFDVLRSLLSLNPLPKIVIAEKPFCNNSQEAKIIIDLYKNKGIELAINYTRRYDKSVIEIREKMIKNKPEIYSCRVNYCRGIKHEGCHAIDFMRYFFGEYIDGEILPTYQKDIFNRDENDFTVPVHMIFEKCPCVIFTPVDGREYYIFEIDIITNKGRIVFSEHGLKIDFYGAEPEPVYGDYTHLSHNRDTFNSDITTALSRLVENVIGKIEGTKELLCIGKDGLAVHKILEDLLG